MKSICTILATASILASSACKSQTASLPATAVADPDALLRIHFVGTDLITKSTNAAVLRKVLELPSTKRLREEVCDRLEAILVKHPSTDRSTAFRAMFDDLINRESWYASRQSPGKEVEWTLALQLTRERADAWRKALGPAQFSVPLVSFMPEETAVQRSGEWLVVGRPGTNSLVWREVAARIQDSGPAIPNQLLEIDANLPRLSRILSLPLPADLASVHLDYTGKGEKVHTEGRLNFDHPVQWRLDDWRVPTNVVNDPLISFTAAQGISKCIGDSPAFKQMFPSRIPNQIMVWARADIPFQTFFGLPLPGAATRIKPVATQVQQFLAAHDGFGEVKMATNGLHFWIEHSPVPLLGLFVGAGKDGGREYLLGGLGNGVPPAGAPTNSPPAELLAQVNGHTNLLYYDWEITSERLGQLRIVSGLLWILARETPPSFVPASPPWLEALNGILGSTVTEITVVSPSELKLVRSSHIGLTAVELLALTKWLECPAFPAFKLPEFSAVPPMPGEKKGK